jgi:hypothetical protein
MDPEEVKEITGRILSEVSKIVAKYDGFVEKYVGDAVMAIFGIPKAHEDDPIRAAKAASEIHQLVDTMSPEIEQETGYPISMHTGINTGLVVTGDDDRVAYIMEKGKIIGAGRLSEEDGVNVLRGMRVIKEYRHHGLGNAILESLLNEISGVECYCIPFRNLDRFYAAKGFNEINPSTAPISLLNRFREYKSRDLDVIIMKKGPMN